MKAYGAIWCNLGTLMKLDGASKRDNNMATIGMAMSLTVGQQYGTWDNSGSPRSNNVMMSAAG